MVSLYLASTSPQRRALLTTLGIPFEVVSPQTSEKPPSQGKGLTANQIVCVNAYRKASEVASRLEEGLVIGGDTLATTNQGKVLGKPKTAKGALSMLRLLSGTWHHVISAVAIVNARTSDYQIEAASTKVFFRKISDAELKEYVETQEPLGKAGAYAIQGKGGVFVVRICGSYTAVVGLPLEIVIKLLEEFGVPISKYWAK